MANTANPSEVFLMDLNYLTDDEVAKLYETVFNELIKRLSAPRSEKRQKMASLMLNSCKNKSEEN